MHGKEYYVSPEAKNQPNAQDYCKSHGGRLFEPKSAEVNNDVANFAKVVIKMPWFWIGIHEMESSEGEFVYESDGEAIGWRNWGPHQPDGNGGEKCVTIHSHQANSHNYWYDTACHLMCNFVCERETDESSYCMLFRDIQHVSFCVFQYHLPTKLFLQPNSLLLLEHLWMHMIMVYILRLLILIMNL